MPRTLKQRHAFLIAKGYPADAVNAYIASLKRRAELRMASGDGCGPYLHEYEDERPGARELGVGRYHDGRGL